MNRRWLFAWSITLLMPCALLTLGPAQGKDKPLREDIRQVGRILGDVVRAQAGLEVYEIVEGVRRHAVEMRRAEASDGVDHDELAIGMPLAARFETVEPGEGIVLFGPRTERT